MSKVYWGLSSVHYAMLDESTGTYGTPKPLVGAVNLGLSIEGESSEFFADNMKFFTATSNNGYTGDLELAKFTDEFLVDAVGYIRDSRGGIAEVASAHQKPFALLFQIEGDESGRRYVYYNAKAARPTRSHSTKSQGVEVGTETSTITIVPHELDGQMYVGYYLEPSVSNASDYQAWFTEVKKPIPVETPGE